MTRPHYADVQFDHDIHKDIELSNSLFQDAYRDVPQRGANAPSQSAEVSTEGKVYQLKGMQYRSGNHNGADALVYIPPGFDPSRPVKVVLYNHGLSTHVSEAFNNSQLKKQMDQADPNTVLVMPEWQATPDSRSGAAGHFYDKGFASNMLQEVMQRTPELSGKNLNDISSISVMTHSGGYNAAAAELYDGRLENKVSNVTLLDSLYDGKLFDNWITQNIGYLAYGTKHFNNFYGESTNDNSRAEANRIQDMLRRRGYPLSAMVQDFNGRTVMNNRDLSNYGIVFKRSDVSIGGRGAHSSVPNIYVAEVLTSQQV